MNNIHGFIQLQGPFEANIECLPQSLQSGNPVITKISISLQDKWPLAYYKVNDNIEEKINIEDRIKVTIGTLNAGSFIFKIGQTGMLELDFDSIQSPNSIKFDRKLPHSTLIDLFIRG